MAKNSDRLAGSFERESGGTLSGLLDEEEVFDRRSLWRLGTWAAVSVGAVIIAILANQSSIGMRRELAASTDLVRQAQQIQLAAKDSLAETRRLASAVETLNGDRDRLYSRIAVLEQGLDSVTGTIARQSSASSPSQSSASAAPAAAAPSASSSAGPPAPAAISAAPAPSAPAAVEPPAGPKPAIASSGPAPVVGPVAATAAVIDKPAPKSAGVERSAAQASVPVPSQQQAPAQPVASLVAPKSMMGPPDPAAAKLIEPATAPKVVTSAPIPDVTATVAKTSAEESIAEASAEPELAVKRTEFGVDVGGANSIPGLRALWRGLLKSKTNAALTTLRPIIVIRENGNGLGMQLRLVAGPISDAAAAAKICATLTVSDRSCTTAVFEGQRLALNPEEQARADAKPAPDAELAADDLKPGQKASSHKRYAGRHAPKEDAPKPESPSTLSRIFGRY
jgi:hypothetical protein